MATATGSAAAWVLSALVVLGAGAAGALSPDPSAVVAATPTSAPSPPPTSSPEPSAPAFSPVEQAQLAAVRLSWPCEGDLAECDYGSGSVVDPSGLILTNAHVAAPASPGLAAQYPAQLRVDVSNPPYLLVSLVSTPEGDAEPRYRASVAAVDGYTDLAVVRIDAMADGSPLDGPVQLPTVPLGALADTRKDAEIRVVGYPASGDSLSPTVQRGTVASKPLDTGGSVDGPWELNTSAPIHGGNSGGLVVDDQGRLIAIPAYRTGGDEQVFRARAVELARPLVEAARSRQPYRSPYLVPTTGREQLVDATWSEVGLDSSGCLDEGDAESAGGLVVQVRLRGLADAEDYRLEVRDPAGLTMTSLQASWSGLPCVQLTVPWYLLEPGTWTVTALVGPDSTRVGTASYEVVDDGRFD